MDFQGAPNEQESMDMLWGHHRGIGHCWGQGTGPSSRGAHSPWCRCCSSFSSSRGRWEGAGGEWELLARGGGQQSGSGLSPQCAAAAPFSPCVRALAFWAGVSWAVFGMKGAVYFALAEAMPGRSGPRSRVSHR